jgi:CBS domain containing-hemolysin-like protein
VQIGVTVVSANAAAFGGRYARGALAGRCAMRASSAWPTTSACLRIVVVSYLSLVPGELIPNPRAEGAEPYALIARPLLLREAREALVWF